MAKNVDTDRTVSPAEAVSLVTHFISRKRPVMLWGPPGIGKSDTVFAVGKSLGRNVIDIRLSLWDPTDIKGIPFFNMKTETMEWAQPGELPFNADATDIIFFDELNSAAPAVQAAAYQLILNRRVGQRQLPAGVDIVAAGNRNTDGGVTYKMPKPLANRLSHLTIRADHESWYAWGIDNNLHPDVMGYLGVHKQDLFDFDPKSNQHAFATPRSWFFTSELLYSSNHLAESQVTDLVSGTVGEGMAVKFMTHRKTAGALPRPEDVLDGKVTELKVKEISAHYSMIIALCYELRDRHTKAAKDKDKLDKWHSSADRFFRFIMDNMSTELVVMGSKVALNNYGLPLVPSKLKTFNEFHSKYGKYIIAAVNG